MTRKKKKSRGNPAKPVIRVVEKNSSGWKPSSGEPSETTSYTPKKDLPPATLSMDSSVSVHKQKKFVTFVALAIIAALVVSVVAGMLTSAPTLQENNTPYEVPVSNGLLVPYEVIK